MFGWFNVQPEASHSKLDSTVDFVLRDERERADRRVFWLLVSQWAITLMAGFLWSPNDAHFDGVTGLVIGAGILTAVPLGMLVQIPGAWQTRWSIALSQGCLSTLLWAVCEGSPQAYFHVFAWTYVMSWYRDIKCVFAISLIALIGDVFVLESGQIAELTLDNLSSAHGVTLAGMIAETAILGFLVQFEQRSLKERIQRDIESSVQNAELKQAYDNTTRDVITDRDQLRCEVAALTEDLAQVEAERTESVNALTSLRTQFAQHGAAIVDLASRREDSDLPASWRDHWQSIRREAQRLAHRIDLPSLLPATEPNFRSAVEVEGLATEVPEELDASVSRAPLFTQRALLVASDPIQKTTSIKALNAVGYEVDVAISGPDAYYSAILNSYDVILVDVDLPKEEGYDVVEAIRDLPPDAYLENVNLFALTSALTPERIMRSTSVGVDGILVKPLKAESLRQSLAGRPSTQSETAAPVCWNWSGAGLTR